MAAKSPFNGYEGIYQWVRERLAELSARDMVTASRSGGLGGDA